MADPDEGVAADGTITTGASRTRVPARYEELLATATTAISERAGGASVYLYGSVATGQARAGRSDVDLLTVGVDRAVAAEVGRSLTARYADLCRGVELAPAMPVDLAGDSDAAYGMRVFLRHYCVHLTGPDHRVDLPAFPADVRAARGFNGDIGAHLDGWRRSFAAGTTDPADLGRRVGRKLLLATGGLVSVHDRTWTTDRRSAARRWAQIDCEIADELLELLTWAEGEKTADRDSVERVLDTTAPHLVRTFAATIGLWR